MHVEGKVKSIYSTYDTGHAAGNRGVKPRSSRASIGHADVWSLYLLD